MAGRPCFQAPSGTLPPPQVLKRRWTFPDRPLLSLEALLSAFSKPETLLGVFLPLPSSESPCSLAGKSDSWSGLPFRLLQELFPKSSELYERVASNREHWTKVSHKFTLRGLPSNNSLDFLDEEYDLQAMAEKDGLKMNGCLDGEDGHGESELE